ncbi:hypothetical protein DUF541 [Candidatus Nitrososphaera gargensis Ga9.2]|uniref:DUF541 domain-containing protein n=1 Tax=Nitrososphaera gargensis (strain Ga9.2) TaxID=1237085 RepID=K0IH38_NITGG|nr:SIMPL domain-containing protein [Candidatus Nitrososphaera gargensis]AFU59175.1 hypothetical protein DUF541 [Candidatus Nitrososphaera gargensis Ga9.2]
MNYFSTNKLQAIAIISAIVISVGTGAFFALGSPIPKAYSQTSSSASLASSSNPTIRVTGDAMTSLMPDRATLVINVQSQPDDLSMVLNEHADKIEEIKQAVMAADDSAKVTVGHRNLSPYYSGGGVPASNDVTFNVYASVAIQTDIDHLSDLVSALAQAGFGFESVYIDPVYYSRLAQVAASTDAKGSVESGENVTDGVKNPITIGVSLNTKPDVLTSAIAEYEAKYRTLLSILEEQDISEDQIKQNNFNIYPQYYGSSQTATYQANTQIIVKTGVDNIQTVSSAIRQVDGVFVENVIISVSDEAIDNARQDLTQQAIANAQQRASEMVEPLGLEVKGIKSIEAVGSQGQNPYGGDVFYRGVKILQPYYYQSINGDISVSVMVEFEIGEETSED